MANLVSYTSAAPAPFNENALFFFFFFFFFPDNDYSNSVDDFLAPLLHSHVLNSFIDKMFAKYMGESLVVNLLSIAAIALLVWMFVICALKPGCLVYNWRQVGASSRHSRHLSELQLSISMLCVTLIIILSI